ncbi:conserved hypothetical protein [Rippkaea orientalis PCC 8801]|uniref:DUF2232 domain-containing protein n=1 Tax=Rippkaea orientalis (strain PCC 8801 / RF-1) TaxID=41431 RepID=B7JZM6_RIPO1|nr:DUF2232 domain-containing protein [Rippkaea orientalis]ACK64969.1 conserved hypothetical protein [Rippkaea orientalis PCC 8801]
MNHFNPSSDNTNQGSELISNSLSDDSNWVDEGDDNQEVSLPSSNHISPVAASNIKNSKTLAMVETAFLASTGSLIWLINYYFPLGPILKIFFPVPIALVYLRWGHRAAWMGALVSGLLLTVLMGPTRSIVFLIPYGLMGIQLGYCWQRGANWGFSLVTGALIGTFGFFFRFWLFSILLGEDLWQYVITQVTELAEWVFLKLGILSQPTFELIQLLAVVLILINSLIYLFAVHLVSLLVLDKLGNPIPRPPKWVKVILDYE